MMDQNTTTKRPSEIRREVITIRPTTTTRAAIRITITQRQNEDQEIAMSTASISGDIPSYLEKPDLLEDLGRAFFVAAHFMRLWNRHVKKSE